MYIVFIYSIYTIDTLVYVYVCMYIYIYIYYIIVYL